MGKKYKPLSTKFKLEVTCITCGSRLDGAAMLSSDRPPRPRDFSLCIDCGQLAQLDEDMKLVKPDPEDLFLLMMSDRWPMIQASQELIRSGGATTIL